MSNVTHFDASWGFDARTACKKSVHVYSDALRRNPIKFTKNSGLVTCKSCRKVLNKEKAQVAV